VDGDNFDRESLDNTYARHLLDQPFGARLEYSGGKHDPALVWRIDWTSEISTPEGLQSDFDFKRHIISARTRLPLSKHQDFGARFIGGWSNGVLPLQRQFAVGGLGSVHGYEFKEQVGDSMALVNLEYALGWRNAFQIVGFFDTGHATVHNGRVTPAPPPAEGGWLNGVGFGIAVAGARVDFGYKLNDVPGSLQVTLRLGRTF